MKPTILAPLDGTPAAAAALPVARGLAALEDAVVQVMHVDGPAGTPPDPAALGISAEQLGGARLTTIEGEPAEQIVRVAVERMSRCIVLCTHTRPIPPPRALGHVTRQVLRTAPCPVLLVPPTRRAERWVPRRILLPHDGTPATAAALAPAADLAERAGAELHVVHIAAPTAATRTQPGTLRAPRYLDQPQHEWPAWAREFLERMAALGGRAALRLRLSITSGDPGREILRFAREHDADLVVLASSGHWEPARAAAIRAVIEGTERPILIVRAGTESSLA